jgi:hypothetical protein
MRVLWSAQIARLARGRAASRSHRTGPHRKEATVKSSSVLVAALFAVTSASACEPSLDTGESELALGSTEPRLELYQTSTKL